MGSEVNLLREYVRELLTEDLAKRQAMAIELTNNVDWPKSTEERVAFRDDVRANGPNFDAARTLKKLFHKYADTTFMDSLVTIHWARTPEEIIYFLDNYSSGKLYKNEISCAAYLPGQVQDSGHGDYGLQIKGHISLLANDMDDINNGNMGDYLAHLDSERTKSSGLNKGLKKAIQPKYLDSSVIDEWKPIVLDEEDWNPRGSEIGMFGNEALVDNWKAVTLIVGDTTFGDYPIDMPQEFDDLDLPVKRPSEIS
jgi:hypothetical protein